MLLGYGAKVCLRKMRVKAENRMVTTVSVKFVYRFGGSISKEKKEVDSSRFGR